jgi:radical SAM protein with 4Fe4S-binding SPASM domain
MTPVVFTNLQSMDLELAEFLFRNGASVIGKLDALNQDKQDRISGVPGTFDKIMRSLGLLGAAGYWYLRGSAESRLGLSFVINKRNIDQAPEIWRFCRDRGIYPNLEMMVPTHRAYRLRDEIPSPHEWETTKRELLRIDRDFGFDWPVYTPLPSSGCLQVLYSLYITTEGYVWPCAGIEATDEKSRVSIRDADLRDVMQSEFIQRARHIEEHLQGKCRDCDLTDGRNRVCIGCRGMAFTLGVQSRKPPLEALGMPDDSCFKPCRSAVPRS